MTILKEYTQKQLETLRSSRVHSLYMNAYLIKESHPESSDLEELTAKLFDISFKKRLDIRKMLFGEMKKAAKIEDYTSAARFRDMLNYYNQHVM